MKLDMSRGAFRAALFLFILALALAALNLLFTAHQVNSVRAAEASAVQLCQAGNTARAQQIILWSHLVVISRPPPRETVQARNQRVKTTKDFLAYVRRIFAKRNCAALTH